MSHVTIKVPGRKPVKVQLTRAQVLAQMAFYAPPKTPKVDRPHPSP